MRRTSNLRRGRALFLALLTTAAALGVDATPASVPIPRPEALTPEPAKALGCADEPSFEGWITHTSNSTAKATWSKTGNIHGYISEVVDDWSCTAYFRYDGLGWVRDDGELDGNYDWGNLINSTSVPCNWTVGSTNYLKANSTTDCADSDAEYAMPIHFDATSTGELLELVAHNDGTPDEPGDFMFIHSDCTTYYGAEELAYNQPFDAANVDNRPGDNCDPKVMDSTNTTQAIVFDATAPTFSFSTPAGAAGTIVGTQSTSYNVQFTASDNVAKFDATHKWSLQRQRSFLTAGVCGTTFTNDGTATTGTSTTAQTRGDTLSAGYCYRWTLSGSDANGNAAATKLSATVIVDTAAPSSMFLRPAPVTTSISRNATSYTIDWTERDSESGIASRSLQRQKVASASDACTGSFANDGSPVTTASPSPQALTAGNCYQWVQTLTDRSGRTNSCTSGKVYVSASSGSTASPHANVTAPAEGAVTYQTASSLNVTWTEVAGNGSISARSLQRQKATGSIGTCSGLTWANDGGVATGASPVNSTAMTEGVYRWLQTLTNSGGKSGVSASGWLGVDTTAPTATITTPAANQPLSGLVTITGSANDAVSFKDYILEYGTGASPSSWTQIGTFDTPVTGGTLGTWATGTLSGIYTIRLRTRQNASATEGSTQQTIVLDNTGMGTDSYRTRIPYELAQGVSLDVGVANGELRYLRDLGSIPSYGPPQSLNLGYSSLETAATGKFGVGWSSNLTQYLTFDIASNITTWHRADGGRVPFGKIGATWTPIAGHHETLTVSGSEVTITSPDQSRQVFESSGAGRLLRIENRFGKALTVLWSASGATVTDASGRGPASGQSYNLVYDSANNRVTSYIDYAGRTWTFGYTGTGASSDLTCLTDPTGKNTRFTYSSHALTKVSTGGATCGADGTSSWTVAYTSGKATSVKDPLNATDLFAYAASTTTAKDVLDAAPTYSDTVYGLDAGGTGIAVSTTTALTDVTTRTYDAWYNLMSESTPIDEGDTKVEYQYDAAGNVTSEKRYIDAGGAFVETLSTYNATNDLLTRTEADNDSATRTVTKYTYDGSGHLTSENRNCTSSGTTIPASGAGGSCTGAGTQNASTNVITNYAYTANHQLEYEKDPLGRVTKHVYDSNGNETTLIANCTSSGTTQPSPFTSCTTTTTSNGGTHNADTNVVTTTTYNIAVQAGKAGLATAQADALGRTTTFTYDALGRQLTDVGPGDTSVPSRTRTTTYDEWGNVLTDTEAWTSLISGGGSPSVQTAHTYDLANRELTVTDPETTTALTTTTYDLAGNITAITTGTGADAVTETRVIESDDKTVLASVAGTALTETIFSPLGQVTQITSPTQVVTTEIHDLRGLTLETQTTPAATGATIATVQTYDSLERELTSQLEVAGTPTGALTTNTYDRLGRLLTTTIDGKTTTYTYDQAGNQLTATDAAGTVTTTSYDALNRATTTVANDVASPTLATEDITTRTFYDAAGNSVAVQDPRGITTRTLYNVRDQASETIANCTNTGTTTPSTNPPACTGGTATTTTNVRTQFTYDGQGHVVKTVSAAGLGSPYTATVETAHDDAGRTRATKDAAGTVTANLYDTAGRLTDVYVNCTTSGTTVPTAYADWSTCAGAGTANGTYNLHTTTTYDDSGNRLSTTAPNGRVTRYVYDVDQETGRLVAMIDNYVDGNPGTTDDITTEYRYDEYGRQAAVVRPGATASPAYADRTIYNADGTIAQQIINCTDSGTTLPTTPETCTGAGTKDAGTNVITSYTYDARGNKISMTAADPSATTATSTTPVTTQYAYDSADRLCRVVENATGSTDLQALANPCSTGTQTAGTATTNTSTRYTYDGAGNLASMIDAAGNTTTYGYDAAGNSTGRTDALGASLVWTYDPLGNRTAQRNRTDPLLTTSVAWTYDPFGRILTRTADSVTTTYTYDVSGNRLAAAAGGQTVTTTYDRLNRVLSVDDEDADTTAETTYTYGLTSATRVDVTGTYAVTLDKFDRATVLDDPVNASNFTWSYQGDGQVKDAGQPNGNTTAHVYNGAGRLTSKDTTAGGTNRALYDWTYNRSGQVLTEATTVTGDPTNNTRTFASDPLARLASFTDGATTTTYGWPAVANRTSVKVGAGASVPTVYDAANRPKDQNGVANAYASDADGRLTARPTSAGAAYQQFTWDHLGRLTVVKNGGGTTLATYTYDPLDRLRMVDYGAGTRTRFRYQGTTTSAVQTINDATSAVIRSIGTSWTGELLEDWTGAGSNLRIYGSNGHHDVTWAASSTGAVSGTVRYDPWGTATSTTGSVPEFRFQSSWADDTAKVSWVVSRWYSPAEGRFMSEDFLLGQVDRPNSRNLYVYAEANPTTGWDPDGQRRVTLDFKSIPPRGSGTLQTNDIVMKNICPTGLWVTCERNKTARIYGVAVTYNGPSAGASGWRGIIAKVTVGTLRWDNGDEDLLGAAASYDFIAELYIRRWSGSSTPKVIVVKQLVHDRRVCVPFPVGPLFFTWPTPCYSAFGGSRSGKTYEISYYAPRDVRRGDRIQVVYRQTLSLSGGGLFIGSLRAHAHGGGLKGSIVLD